MRVLVVTQYFWPENFRINDLVTELSKRGHKVTVLTGKPNYPSGEVFESYKNSSDKFMQYGDAQVHRVPMLARGTGAMRLFINYVSFVLGAVLCGPWLLRAKSYDAIFVFEPSPVTVGLPAILLGKLKKAPVVFWALDLWPETLAAIGVVRSQRILHLVGHLVRFIYNRCTLVLGQSRGFLPSIAKHCNDPDKIRYFPSWAEDVFSETSTKAPEVEQLEGVFNILFAGNVGEAQDLPAVLDAVEKLKTKPNIRWLIVGDGRMSSWLSDEIARRKLAQNIVLLGRYPVERMPSFYAHADALLVSLKKNPVFSMTIPGKVQSYLMSGIPILGMLDGVGATVIEDSGAGFTCEAGNSSGLADAVVKMEKLSDAQRNELGMNGRRYAEKEFERSMLIGRLENLMEEAVDTYNKEMTI